MENVIIIGRKSYEELIEKVEQLTSIVDSLTAEGELGVWIDGQIVCEILGVTPRTLQTYRENGTIPYSQVNSKIYYRTSDIKKLLKA